MNEEKQKAKPAMVTRNNLYMLRLMWTEAKGSWYGPLYWSFWDLAPGYLKP